MSKPHTMIGTMPIGPKCARKAGLVQPRRTAKTPVKADEKTMDLFGATG